MGSLPLAGGVSQALRPSALGFHPLGLELASAQHPEVSKQPVQDNF